VEEVVTVSVNYPASVFKKFQMSFYGVCALAIIFVASGFRVVLTSLGWPSTNGDEAIMNLMALHIKERGEHPVFYYGQNYLGSVEAHFGAVMFTLFGTSVWSMRLGSILFYAGFLGCMYLLTSRIYSKRLALFVLVFLGLGTEYVLMYQLQITGYTELPFLCALLLLISYALASAHHQISWYSRAVLYLLWGIVAGLTLWAHLVTVPYILVSGLLLLLCCWRELLKWSMWCTLLGLVIGAWPMIYYNIHAAHGQDSIHIFLNMGQLGAGGNYLPSDYINSSLFIALPAASGLYPRCYVKHVPFIPSTLPDSQLCIRMQQIYGISYLLLFLVALVLASVAIIGCWHYLSKNKSFQERQQLTRQYARLMLLLGAALTFIVFTRNTASVFTGVVGLRYIICTLVSLPAILWPLWNGIAKIKGTPRVLSTALFALRIGILLLVLMVNFRATSHSFEGIPQAQSEKQRLTQLAERLEQMQVTRFYSEYWTCNRLMFESHEKLICGDTWNSQVALSHGYDRYLPYQMTVRAAANPGFVFPAGMPQITVLEKALKSSRIPYQHVEFDGYEIYQPAHPIPGQQL